MGALTETMIRLLGEIGVLRHERVVLAKERRTRVFALRSAVAKDLSSAHRAWFGPTISERRAEEKKQRMATEAEANARLEREQHLARTAEAKAKREHEQQRLAEEADAKSKRDRRLAAAEANSHGHTAAKATQVPTQRPQLKGSKKH